MAGVILIMIGCEVWGVSLGARAGGYPGSRLEVRDPSTSRRLESACVVSEPRGHEGGAAGGSTPRARMRPDQVRTLYITLPILASQMGSLINIILKNLFRKTHV